MRILFFVFANKHTGLGHWFRSITVAQQARSRGHQVFVASDRIPPDYLIHLPLAYNDPVGLIKTLEVVKPDWLVVDLPHTLPPWIEQIAHCRICVLNGIGYDQANNIDLRVIQGVADLELPQDIDISNTVMGVEYVVLRPELQIYSDVDITSNDMWLVWGGAADSIGLLNRFGVAMADAPAILATVDMTPPPYITTPNHFAIDMIADDTTSMINWLAGSKALCTAMGMICWESAYFGIPAYVYSLSDIHLIFAQGMAEAGLIKAWPDTGLPDNDQIRDFLEQPFEVDGQRPDLDGAKRIVKLMER